MISVITEYGVPINVRVIDIGEKYGINDSLVNTSHDMYVEFYDGRYPHTEYGQFISRYYLETIMVDRNLDGRVYGLNLDNAIPDWTIDSKNMAFIVRELKEAHT